MLDALSGITKLRRPMSGLSPSAKTATITWSWSNKIQDICTYTGQAVELHAPKN